MAKVIKELGIVECIDITPAHDGPWHPGRKNYIGCIGQLKLYESEKKFPGEKFLYFWGFDFKEFSKWDLKTSYGDLTIDGDILTFLTKNSRYVFKK